MLMLLSAASFTFAQKFKSTTSNVHFYSDAPVEDIEATNLDGQSALDLSTGDIVFSIPIKSFTFEKSLMQEHFNENYLESDKYPRAFFKGKVSNYDVSKPEFQNASAKGFITIHGVEKELSTEGQIKINGNSFELKAKFPVKLEDFKIKIPKVVFYNIAEIVDVTVTFNYEKID
jgi:polyisoprenoid-binding protein YceI